MPENPILRVLLDENVDRQLKALFPPDLEVVTVREHGWAGLSNGMLLRAAAAEFDVFVTMDRSLPYQQNLKSHDVAVVVIHAVSNAFADVSGLMPDLEAAIRRATVGTATVVSR